MSTTHSGDFVSALQEAIRQNPISAALVGMGVLWMFTGGNKISAAAAFLSPAARAATSGVGSGVQASADAAGAVRETVSAVGSRVADGMRDAISDTATAVSETASQAYDAIKGPASDAMPKVTAAGTDRFGSTEGIVSGLQHNLQDTFERQPLLLAAIGLSLGAGMAAAMPPTEIESKLTGEAADRAKALIQEISAEQVDKVAETAKRTLDAVKEEAKSQGLTTQAAKDGAVTLGEKLKAVTQAAREK